MLNLDLATTLQIAQLLAYIISMAIFIIMMKADIKIVKNDISLIHRRADSQSEKLNVLTDAFAKLAVQDNRIKNVEEDVKDLRHGKGFVTGEYDRHGSSK